MAGALVMAARMRRAATPGINRLQPGTPPQPGRIQVGPYADGYREPREANNLRNTQFGPGPQAGRRVR